MAGKHRMHFGRTYVRRILYPGNKAMRKVKKDPIREDRIDNEAIVDAYGPEERALGWYYYLENQLRFPFDARCIATRVVSPLDTLRAEASFVDRSRHRWARTRHGWAGTDNFIRRLPERHPTASTAARRESSDHRSFRLMKIIKIDKMIKRLENGEDIPQSKIEHTIGHMPFPLYNPNG
jgi:hypothetical protein